MRIQFAPSLISVFLIWLVGVATAYSQTSRNVRPLSAKEGEEWRIRWDRSDDFNGEQVDWRKWNRKPENFGAWNWDNDANIEVLDGHVRITMRRLDKPVRVAGRRPTPYTSGMLKSHVTGTYGYYEARIKGASLFPGVCPSFWLYSKIDDSIVEAGACRYSEIDIVELTQRGDRVPGNERIADLNLHTILSKGEPGIPGRAWRRPNDERYRASQANEVKMSFDPREDFHTYGCKVTPEEITWYIDGKEIGQKQNQFWHRKMNVALSLGLRPPYAIYTAKGFVPADLTDTDDFPTSMLIDYVRVWELTD